MNVCVFGIWHLGAVISACLAKTGHTVIGLDPSKDTVEALNRAEAPVSEPGLNDLIRENLQNNHLKFTCDPAFALAGTDVVWIAFDTPVDDQDTADFPYIERQFDTISGFIPDRTKIIISSQVPVGFTRYLSQKFHDKYPDKDIFFSYSPENLRLGKALQIFLEPDRIVIGTRPENKHEFSPIFSSICDRQEWMGIESAEMTKHAINAYLATSICFANEIATICEYVGADAREVERGLKTEDRIGQKAYLKPGSAFSGGTLARDIRFLQKIGENSHLPVPLINSVLESNEHHKTWVKRKCKEILGNIEGKHISVLGLTYKPGTDTLRRSLSVELCRWLHDEGAIVTAFDPVIRELPHDLQKILSLSHDMDSVIKNADCLIIATEWPDFRNLHKESLIHMRTKILIDPNGYVEPNLKNISEIRYVTVGRDRS